MTRPVDNERNQPTKTKMTQPTNPKLHQILDTLTPESLRTEHYQLWRQVFDMGIKAERNRARLVSGGRVAHWLDGRARA
jgi:ribosomal protein L18E